MSSSKFSRRLQCLSLVIAGMFTITITVTINSASSARLASAATNNQRRVHQSLDRIESILSRMSLKDKISQLAQIDINLLLKDDGLGGKVLDETLIEHWISEVGVGSVLNTVGGDVTWNASQFRSISVGLQQAAVKKQLSSSSSSSSSDVIMPIWGLDSVHGANYVHGAIITPQPINIAATFNQSVSEWAGVLASRDTRAAGISWIFSPLLGIAIEPRWSRVFETFGEDPVVVGQMAKSMIGGIQRIDQRIENDNNKSASTSIISSPRRAAACAKHFIGYSFPRTGHDRSPSWIPTRHLYNYFVPPWRYILRSDKYGPIDEFAPIVNTVMESYTETDGVPNAENRQTTINLLRRQLQYQGVLVTDYEEMRNLYSWHSVASDATAAILESFRETSIDMSMIPWAIDEFLQTLAKGVENHQLSTYRIDASVRRILQLKLELDLIGKDNAMTIEDPNVELVGRVQDRKDALDAAHQSIILVQNNHDVLPISDSTSYGSIDNEILVVGPTANSLTAQSGGWTWQWQGVPMDEMDPGKWFTYGTTVYKAFHEVFGETALAFRCGVSTMGGDCSDLDSVPEASDSIIDKVENWLGWDEGMFEAKNSIGRAVVAAETARLIVICVGEEAYAEKPGDIRSLRLPQGQYDLVKSLRSANENATIILVYFGGRPRLLIDMVDHSDAILVGFLPGPDAGQAIVDIIIGATNPSGHLPLTYPMNDDGGGIPYFHSLSDQCTKGDTNQPLPHYEYIPCPVQWPFGHGLSYTSFQYSNLDASGGIDRDLTIQVTVTNTGSRAGAVVVLFYTFDEFRSVTPEYKRLRAFEKIELQPNESKDVRAFVFKVDLSFVGPHDDHHYILDPTMITWVGVGDVDCRQEPHSNVLCYRLESPDKDKPYVAACDAACNLWMDKSGCASYYQLTRASCWDSCMSVSEIASDGMAWNNEGWGWNYVDCIDAVIWGFQSENSAPPSCSRLTSLCRNVFETGTLDEFGLGRDAGISPIPTQSTIMGNYIALITALVTSGVIMFFMNGGMFRRQHRHDSSPHVQFASVNRNEMVE